MLKVKIKAEFGQRLLAATALAGCTALLAACSGGSDGSDDASKTEPTAAPSTVAEDGTTVPGVELALGEKAVVHYNNAALKGSLLQLSITSVKQGKIKDLAQFTLSDAAKASSVYYVKVAVANQGDEDLGSKQITLYGKVSDTLVVPPVGFGSTFAPCNYQPLPKKFAKGAKASVCMVMLAPKHGEISAIEWRSADEAEPISWAVR